MFFQDLQGSPSFWPLKLQQVLFSCLVSMLLWRIPPEPPQRYWVYHVFNPSLSIFKTLLKKSQLRMVKSSENPTRWARPPSYVYVSPCFTMFHHVSPCFTMFHHVSPCFTMFHHVSPCFTMFHHPTTSIPHINPNLEAFIRRGTCCLKSWKKQIQSARSMQWGNRLSASKAQHSGRFEQKLTTKNPNSWT